MQNEMVRESRQELSFNTFPRSTVKSVTNQWEEDAARAARDLKDLGHKVTNSRNRSYDVIRLNIVPNTSLVNTCGVIIKVPNYKITAAKKATKRVLNSIITYDLYKKLSVVCKTVGGGIYHKSLNSILEKDLGFRSESSFSAFYAPDISNIADEDRTVIMCDAYNTNYSASFPIATCADIIDDFINNYTYTGKHKEGLMRVSTYMSHEAKDINVAMWKWFVKHNLPYDKTQCKPSNARKPLSVFIKRQEEEVIVPAVFCSSLEALNYLNIDPKEVTLFLLRQVLADNSTSMLTYKDFSFRIITKNTVRILEITQQEEIVAQALLESMYKDSQDPLLQFEDVLNG